MSALNLRFSRRRYGVAHFYCWASVQAPDGTWLQLGDPWPAVNWPRLIVEAVARRALAKHAGDEAQAEHWLGVLGAEYKKRGVAA